MRWDESCRVARIVGFGREASGVRRIQESWYACIEQSVRSWDIRSSDNALSEEAVQMQVQ